MIKPITDECRGMKQQWVSYKTLGCILGGIVFPTSLMKVLKNPGLIIVYDRSSAMDIDRCKQGVELIHQVDMR